MKLKNIGLSLAVISALGLGFTGCGSSSDNNTSTTKLTVVDPYIQDAVMYWDKNKNGIYDEGELVSTSTSKYGNCEFNQTLPNGAIVRMKSKGIHNGIPFDGSLTANISGTGIVSPMTTLVEKFDGNTTAVIDLLKDTGIELTSDDLTKDPMAGLDSSSPNLDNDIKKIQASIAINTFLEIIGTDANATKIKDKSSTLKKALEFTKKAITTTRITSSNLGVYPVINATVAAANYITDRENLGDSSALNTLSKDDDTINTLINALTTKYEKNPNKNFGLDATKPITKTTVNNLIRYSIKEVKAMTAHQFFNFVGNSLSIEASGGFDGSSVRDANGSDDLDPAYMNWESSSLNGSNMKSTWIDFSWDDGDKDKDNNRTEHIKSWEIFKGSLKGTIANGSIQGTIDGIDEDGKTQKSGTVSAKNKSDGNVQISQWQENYNDKTVAGADKTIFISAQKIDSIAGIHVGNSTRDVYKVKYKDQYGQIDGNKFILTGDGYNTDEEWNCTGYDNNVSKYVKEKIDNRENASGGANEKLIFAKNGKFINKDTNKTVDNVYWRIKNNILQVRGYDDYDFKIENDKCIENWKGDMTYQFLNLTKTEANSILKVLVPNEHLTVDTK